MYCIELKDERDTLKLGELLGSCLRDAGQSLSVVYLRGDLGMGKTTLCRGILSAFGHIGPVKSPTYTLVEQYSMADHEVYHFDIYRLGDPEELEYMGIRDFLSVGEKPVTCIVEWPEKGQGVLPLPHLELVFSQSGEGRKIEFCIPVQESECAWRDELLVACEGVFASCDSMV